MILADFPAVADYRTVGSTGLDALCLLDVLAAAEAARLSSQKFSFQIWDIGRAEFPILTGDHVAVVRSRLAVVEKTGRHLDKSCIDMVRSSGQMPSLTERIKSLTSVSDDILAYDKPRAALKVSLCLETYHVSDVPAAQRDSGSESVPRFSHPGRNALAASALIHLQEPRIFMAPLTDETRRPSFMSPRQWVVPLEETSWDGWVAMMQTPMSGRNVIWVRSDIINRGKMVRLGVPGTTTIL